jgi:hypothetical protein
MPSEEVIEGHVLSDMIFSFEKLEVSISLLWEDSITIP